MLRAATNDKKLPLIVFNEQEFMVLVMAINTINSWNRIGIATRLLPSRK
ncbi:carboxymuconolactone decarboxylase family protein [Paenibacillus roseipurpureus]|uniref:Uncharacterized protein n=1 Tax=Paenibacillus roseopurpureus TaxID=2918901 RepID=A0AA96LUG4_9BACL|nr:hypothetical protein [Paenibacillus sp. MBLB1832]WNR44860.1 hypothetical protein MJB10_01535 [Paenibacillus sp. MBLB1832]